MKRKTNPDCGPAWLIGRDGKAADLYCVLPKSPRHRMHLFGDPKWTAEERAAAIEQFKKLTAEVKP